MIDSRVVAAVIFARSDIKACQKGIINSQPISIPNRFGLIVHLNFNQTGTIISQNSNTVICIHSGNAVWW
ncbi:hypothetical protein SALWKB29_1663 [Snodgrassella communis]|uniref:Uncharacterized protein n=1 Tax=Snodgrassella communis TaxID=2946699 RepID=A0A836MNW8_9NEIS|nr:hypothetical protein SALWKB29_1663 [Snodgrassella communis]